MDRSSLPPIRLPTHPVKLQSKEWAKMAWQETSTRLPTGMSSKTHQQTSEEKNQTNGRHVSFSRAAPGSLLVACARHAPSCVFSFPPRSPSSFPASPNTFSPSINIKVLFLLRTLLISSQFCVELLVLIIQFFSGLEKYWLGLFDLEEFGCSIEKKMGSEDAVPLGEKVNVELEASVDRDCPGKKNLKKVPKRIHKAEREKQKREHLNELFFELSNSLDLKQPNNGKASILCEATRLLKDLLAQIECLRKENASLLSESHYVMVEKNELREENSTLETQIGRLQSELEARVAQSKPDLNAPPPDCLTMPAPEPTLGQAHTVLVLPLRSNLQAYPLPDAAQMTSNPTSNVSKPHARYPTSADSWPAQLLRQQPIEGKDSDNVSDRERFSGNV